MTDTVYSLNVALDQDIRTDDLEAIKSAIMQLRHVIAVDANIADLVLWTAERRAKLEIANKMWEVLK